MQAMRAATCLAFLAALVSATSCGSERANVKAASSTEASTTTSGNASSSWGVGIAEPPRARGDATLVQQLNVFSEQRTAADAFDSVFPSGADSDTAEGKELNGESRLLVGTFGAERMRIFGVPTENGWVCPQFVYADGEEGDGGPCFSTLRGGVSFSIDGDDSLYRLYGVAGDDVKDVTVITPGKRFAADLGRNGFVFEASPAAVCPTEIEQLMVTHDGGRTSTIDLADVSSLPAASGSDLGCY